jgi:hypothetical protein
LIGVADADKLSNFVEQFKSYGGNTVLKLVIKPSSKYEIYIDFDFWVV